MQLEEERTASGGAAPSLTVFLAGSECPFSCVFCDLWRFTLDTATPAGALPAQLRLALDQARGSLPERRWPAATIKLYNASNFFDRRAVPPEDYGALVDLVAPFRRVVVESHPKLLGRRCWELGEALGGRLEVAMGLETVHPGAFPLLNKGMTLADFDRAMEQLQEAAIASRIFVLLGAPFVPAGQAAEWAMRSVRYAIERGAETVSLIPARGGKGELRRLAGLGEFAPPSLELLERTLEQVMEQGLAPPGSKVTADLWDVDLLPSCPACASQRIERLRRMNLSGRLTSPIGCPRCAGDCVANG